MIYLNYLKSYPMPLNILRKAISWAYLTFIPLILIYESAWKDKTMQLKSSGVFNSIRV